MAFLVFFLLFVWFIILLWTTLKKHKQVKNKPKPPLTATKILYPTSKKESRLEKQKTQQFQPHAEEVEPIREAQNLHPTDTWINRASILMPVYLEYVDSKGACSERQVDLTHFSEKIGESGELDLVLEGFCHLRNGRRSFLASRAEKITIVETGEIFSNSSEFRRHLIDQYLNSEEGKLNQFFGNVGADLTEVAFYLGRLEGKLKTRATTVLTPILADLAGITVAEMNSSPVYKKVRKAAGYDENAYQEACISLLNNKEEHTKRQFQQLLEELSVDGRGKPDKLISEKTSKLLKSLT